MSEPKYTWYVDGDKNGPLDRDAKSTVFTTSPDAEDINGSMELWRRVANLTGRAFTYEDLEKGAEKMRSSGGLREYAVRNPISTPQMPPEGTHPTRGYIQHFSCVPPGERWPVLRFRVCGFHPNHVRVMAMLDVSGSWRWFDDTRAFHVPNDCTLSQSQLGDVLARAGVAPGLPWQEHDRYTMGDIGYVEPRHKAAQAKTEEWRPDAPKWRGGKPWR